MASLCIWNYIYLEVSKRMHIETHALLVEEKLI